MSVVYIPARGHVRAMLNRPLGARALYRIGRSIGRSIGEPVSSGCIRLEVHV